MHVESWSVAIFAHNEQSNITACLDAVVSQAGIEHCPIFVLINGSRDDTEKVVRKYAAVYPNVRPITIELADKTNAWNQYIHHLAPSASAHFFVDGDTKPMPGAFADLVNTLSQSHDAHAVGALPASGRDRVAWSHRMVTFGRLAGCLYALRGDYVEGLRRNGISMPIGLIGEDLFLSCLVKDRFDETGLNSPSPYLVFAANASFWFRSLSATRFADWMLYARRLIRYQIRDYQLLFLLKYLSQASHPRIPEHIVQLYNYGYHLPLLQWRGRMTPFYLLAVWQIRKQAKLFSVQKKNME